MVRGDDDRAIVPMSERAIEWRGRVQLDCQRWCRKEYFASSADDGRGSYRDGELEIPTVPLLK